AVTKVNERWPRKCVAPEAEPATVRAKAVRPVANRSTRRVAPAGWLATARRPRTHRATGEALLVPARKGGSWVGRITGSTGKSADDERVADGPVVAVRRGNARGAKGPCCSCFLH